MWTVNHSQLSRILLVAIMHYTNSETSNVRDVLLSMIALIHRDEKKIHACEYE